MKTGDRAWIALATGVLAYEILADDLMSHAVDRYLEAHPWITRTVVAVTSLHLLNLMPRLVDPFYLIDVARGRRWD